MMLLKWAAACLCIGAVVFAVLYLLGKLLK